MGTAPAQHIQTGLARRLATLVCDALPGWRLALAGSAAWAAAMAGSAAARLVYDGWASVDRVVLIVVLFALGGLLAFAPALWLARLVSPARSQGAFAAMFLALATMTIAATAFLFAMQYRLYFAEWHEPAFTITWMFQFAFTSAAAVYQFLVLGLPLFFPLGLLALLGAALWHARSVR